MYFRRSPASPWRCSGTTLPRLKARMPSWYPAALPMATTCALGAIARFSPVMESVRRFAAAGGPVLGICNGFQILCESGLLPGALLRNAGLKYVCRQVHLRVETADSIFTNQLRAGQVLCVPVGHMEGNYFCDAQTLAHLEGDKRIAFVIVTRQAK